MYEGVAIDSWGIPPSFYTQVGHCIVNLGSLVYRRVGLMVGLKLLGCWRENWWNVFYAFYGQESINLGGVRRATITESAVYVKN